MQIIPAVDVLDGKVVRLLRGDYGQPTTYLDSPASAVSNWEAAGASMVHVVDLDGARRGSPSLGLVEAVASVGVPFQIGGGIRTADSAAQMVERGASRVVLGSSAVWEPELLAELVNRLGSERVVAAVDVKAGLATGAGWLDEGRPFADVISAVADSGVGWILVTGISRDGTLSGPDLDLTSMAVEAGGGAGIIGSGGVGSLEDLVDLQAVGAGAAIVGKALYEGAFSLQDAIGAVTGQ